MPDPASPPTDPEIDPLLNHKQRRLLGFSVSLLALVLSIALFVFIFIVLERVLAFFSGVLWPIAVAGILALILRPVVDRLEYKFKGRRVPAVLVLFGAFGLSLAGLILAFGPPLAVQVIDFFSNFPAAWARMVEYAKTNYPSWNAMVERILAQPAVGGVVEGFKDQAGKIPSAVMPSLKAAGAGLFAMLGFFAHLIVVPFYLFFFLLSKTEPTTRLPGHLSFLREPVRNDIVFLVREFLGIIVSFFRGQLLIGILMGILLAIGFSIIGLQYGLVLGLLLGVLNIVPYLGTVIGVVLTVPLALLQPDGGPQLVLFVLIVYTIVQNIEGWFLTPKIMGDRTGLHPVTIIIAIFFWGTALDGVLGMVLAIPLTAFFVTAWRLMDRKYFNRPTP